MNRVHQIEQEIASLRDDLNRHPLYRQLESVTDIQTFSELHVFAVWDFMSLLKALQRELTCIHLPWLPAENPKTARFINEIVHGEESDINEIGEPKSHFEMYLDAMKELGASTEVIEQFVAELRQGVDIFSGIDSLEIDERVQSFLGYTFELIKDNQPHKIAAAFTFGREDVIPDMFLQILNQSESRHQPYPKFAYYLERHIELDGDEHGPLSLEMINELCGEDDQKWLETTQVAQESLKKRIELWDAISDAIVKRETSKSESQSILTH